MQQFFSKILKNKKILLLTVPLFVAIGIIIPTVAHAGWAGCAVGATLGAVVAFFTAGIGTLGGVALITAACVGVGGVQYVLGDSGTDLMLAILFGIGGFLYFVTHSLALFSVGWLQSLISSTFFTTPITSQSGFIIGWTQVRDLSNMIIVLGFVVVGIATALRIGEYGAKKLLPKLIIMALLINFSGLFCGLIIDGTNILTTHFLEAGGTDVGEKLLGAFDGSYGEITWKDVAAKATSDPGDGGASYVQSITFYIVANVMIAFVFFYLTLLLVARQAIFGVLFVLSPIAFICWVFPATKKLWTKWWDNFIKWGLLSVQLVFFIWLAAIMVGGAGQGGLPTATHIVEYFSVLVILYVAIRVAKKSSADGAGVVMALAGAGLGYAIGAGKVVAGRTAGAVAERTGRNKYSQAAREGISSAGARIAEATGFAPQGYAAQQKAGRAATARKQVDALRTGSGGDKSRFEQLVKTGKGAVGAAAIASANEHGDLGKLLNPNNDAPGLNQMRTRVAHAKAFGHEGSEFEKKNYQLKQFNDNATDQALTAMGHKVAIDGTFKNPAEAEKATAAQRIAAAEKLKLPVDAARQKVMMTQLADTMPQMSVGELGRIDSTHLGVANHEFTRENITPHMVEKIGVTSNRALIAGIIADRGNFENDLATAQRNNDKAETNRLQKIINSIDKLPGATISGGGSGTGLVGGAGI